MNIETDDNGYPTEESLRALREWQPPVGTGSRDPYTEGAVQVLDAVAAYFNGCGYGRATKRSIQGRTVWRFATGGWSGCEEVLGALPALVYALAWRSTHRGGLHVYGLEVQG